MSSLVEVADQLDINSDRDVSIAIGSDPVVIVADFEVEVIEVPEQGPPGPMGPVSTTPGPPGPQGPQGYPGLDGTLIRYGTTNPTPEIGNNGDSYINKTTNFLFGPKAGGSWPAGVSLIGPQGVQGVKGDKGDKGDQGIQGIQGPQGNDGNTVLYGTSDPLAAVGVNGNFYINQTTHVMFGPKAAGAWPAGVSMIGPQGPIGPPGGATCYVGDAPPAGAPDGALWWKTSNGQFYIKYNDGNSTQWVIAVPAPDMNAFVQKVGDQMAGPLLLAGDPTAALGAATKQYVDASRGNSFTGVITVAVAANAVTFAVKHMTGVDPSAATPVYYRVPQVGGGYADKAITAPLSMTIPAGATMGAIANVAFRIWIAIFDDAGTPRLAARNNCNATPAGTFLLRYPEHLSATVVTPPGNNAAEFCGNVAVAAKFWAWLGWFSWEAGLAAPGTWNVGPSQVCATLLDGMPRPGDMIFMRANRSTVNPSSTTTAMTDSTLTIPWNSWSAADPVEITLQQGYVYLRTAQTHGQGQVFIRRDSVVCAQSSVYSALTGDLIGSFALGSLDFPNTTAQVVYKFSYQNVQALQIQYQAQSLVCKEYMA